MIYVYVSVHYNRPDEVLAEVKQYAKRKGLPVDEVIQDEQHNTVPWTERQLFDLINQAMKAGDALLVYEASNLGRSTTCVLDVLEYAAEKGIVIHFAKYDQIFPSEDYVNTEAFLELLQVVDSDFLAKKTTDKLAGREGISGRAGRPKGRKNRNLKLDKYRDEIQKYLDLNINRASIAKLIGCHPQTLQNYIELRNLHNSDSETD